MSIETYRDPIFIKWHMQSGQKVSIPRNNEQYQIVKSKIILNEIPDEFNSVQIDDYVELKFGQQIANDNEFVVSNWGIGELTFHPSKEGEFITVNSYHARGVVYYPSSRIYTKLNSEETDIEGTFQEFIDSINAYQYKGDYDGSTTYEINQQVLYKGSVYICTQQTIGNLPTNETYWRVLAAGLNDKQDFDVGTQYYLRDVVWYDDEKSLYVAISSPPIGTLPTNATYWDKLISVKQAFDDIEAKIIEVEGRMVVIEDDYNDVLVPIIQSAVDNANDTANSLEYKGEYNSLTEYIIRNFVYYENSLYICIQDSQGNLPTNVTYWSKVTNGFVFKGAYGGGISYEIFDVVTYLGSSYLCIQDSIGNIPTNASYWSILASKGEKGAELTFKGLYSGIEPYETGDLVYYTDGITTGVFWAKTGTTGNLPTDTTYWEVFMTGGGNMNTSVYDQDNNGVVDNSEMLGGEVPSYYTTADNINLEDIGEYYSATPTVEDALQEVGSNFLEVINARTNNIPATPTTYDNLSERLDNEILEVYNARTNNIPATPTTYDNLSERLDNDYNDIQDEIGILSSLTTTEKASLVGAINEVDGEIDDIAGVGRTTETVKANADNHSTHLNDKTAHGLDEPDYTDPIYNTSSIFATGTGKDENGLDVDVSDSIVDKAPISDISIQGNTVTNMLEDNDADCEDLTNFTDTNVATALNTDNKIFGTNAIKLTLSAGQTQGNTSLNIFSSLVAGKYYLISVYLKNGTATNLKLRFASDDQNVESDAVTATSYNRASIVIAPTDFDTATVATLQIEINGAETQLGYVDGIMLQEITSTEYASGGSVLLQKYNWHTGTKPTNGVALRSVNKNLFNKNQKYLEGTISSDTGDILTNSVSYSVDGEKVIFTSDTAFRGLITQPIKVGQNKNITIKSINYLNCGIRRIQLLDSSLNHFSMPFSSAGLAAEFTLNTNNASYIRVYIQASSTSQASFDNFQIEYSPTATTYAKHEVSEVFLPKIGNSLPNGTKDEFNVTEGKKYQRVSNEYVTLDTDYTVLITSLTNVDLVRLQFPTDFKTNSTDTLGTANIYGYNEILKAARDDTSKVGSFYVENTYADIIVTKGTYVDLAAAKTALAGTTIIYQLAQPIVTELPPQSLMVFKDGTVYVTPGVVKHTQVYDSGITLPKAIGTTDKKWIERVVLVDGESRTYVDMADVTVASTTSIAITGATNEVYEVVYQTPLEDTTQPEFVCTYPINIAGAIASIGSLASATNAELTKFSDYALAVLLDHESRLQGGSL